MRKINSISIVVLLMVAGSLGIGSAQETFDLQELDVNTYATNASCSVAIGAKLKFSPGECIAYRVTIKFIGDAARHITIKGKIQGVNWQDRFTEAHVVDSFSEVIDVFRVIPDGATPGDVHVTVQVTGENLKPPCQKAKATARKTFFIEQP